MKTKILNIALIILIIFTVISCSKLLDEKSNLRLSTPETVEDFQALLDRYSDIISNYAASGEVSADDYYLSDADFTSLRYEEDKRLYTWRPDYVSTGGGTGNDWLYCYKAIYIANSVLHDIEFKNLKGAENVKGQALTIRASRYLDGLQIWTPAYNYATANSDLGLPLRLDPDMNLPSVRATVQETYDQVIRDLEAAIPLLPIRQIAPSRPSRVAAYGLLARTYLYIGNYKKALENSLQALDLDNSLMDFNALNQNDAYPIKDLNNEILYNADMRLSGVISSSIAKIPKKLYELYDDNDLRKSVFFRIDKMGDIFFRGYYLGMSNGRLSGIALDELYLISAECFARENKVDNAMDILNKLLITRWKAGTFEPITANDKDEALGIILNERRKELLMRGLRWSDIKRYNRDGANITLSRTIHGEDFVLPPNDLRYAIAIPEDIIEISGISQNTR